MDMHTDKTMDGCPYSVNDRIKVIVWTSYYIGYRGLIRENNAFLHQVESIKLLQDKKTKKIRYAYKLDGLKHLYFIETADGSQIPKLKRVKFRRFRYDILSI